MRATVLRDPALAKHAGRFVWLSIDTEDPRNAAFVERYPAQALPTFEVLDPGTKRVAYRWIGGVDAKELQHRFDEGERAFHDSGASDPAGPQSADVAVLALQMAGEEEACAR